MHESNGNYSLHNFWKTIKLQKFKFKITTHVKISQLSTSLSTSHEQIVSARLEYRSCCKVVLTTLIQICCNKLVINFTTQDFSDIVMYIMAVPVLLEQPCNKFDSLMKICYKSLTACSNNLEQTV